jgi:heptosyltransferase-2
MGGGLVVLWVDTGPMHLARLVAAPLIALFGPTMPSQFIIEDERTVALWGGAHLACRPCYDGRELATCANNVCMSSIAPAKVLDVARRLLA